MDASKLTLSFALQLQHVVPFADHVLRTLQFVDKSFGVGRFCCELSKVTRVLGRNPAGMESFLGERGLARIRQTFKGESQRIDPIELHLRLFAPQALSQLANGFRVEILWQLS